MGGCSGTMFKTEEKDFEIALCLIANQLGILQNGVNFLGIVEACVLLIQNFFEKVTHEEF
jgi:hypothetical protein